jgi:hypothetical protein
VVRKKPPDGFVSWGRPTFERLTDAEPEPLKSSFQVTHAMLLNVIGRKGDAFAAMRHLLTDNHEEPAASRRHIKRAIANYRALLAAGVVERLDEPDADGRTVRLTVDLQYDFALNQPLSPFALAALELLDAASPTYALDVLSVIESTLDDPRQVLSAQQFKARGEAVAQMKADGVEYEERMERLDGVTYPKPLEELLDVEQPFEKQDLQIADLIVQEGRALVIALNKWDLVRDPVSRLTELRETCERLLPQIRGVPLVPISGLSGRGLDKLVAAVFTIEEMWNRRLPTRALNTWLHEAVEAHPPPAASGRRIKLRYMTEANARQLIRRNVGRGQVWRSEQLRLPKDERLFANAAELRVVLQAPQDLLQGDPGKGDVLRPFDHCLGPGGLRMTDSVQEQDPDARVDDDEACRRPSRIEEEIAFPTDLAASCRMRHRRRLRTSRRRARSTTPMSAAQRVVEHDVTVDDRRRRLGRFRPAT